MAGGLGPHDLAAEGLEVGVGTAGTEQVADRPFPGGEQAVAEGAVGGEAYAVAGAAEVVGDAGDDTDLAVAVGEPIAVGRRRVVVARADGLEGEDGADARDDLVGGHHVRALPGVGGVQRHVLDEADRAASGAGEGREVDDLVVVDAPHQHDVDLDGSEPGVCSPTRWSLMSRRAG